MKQPEIFDYIKLLHKFQTVTRSVKIPRRNNFENDTEHSYQLAMLAWYIVEKNKLPYSHELLLKYALAHDLVETFAGDTCAFSAS